MGKDIQSITKYKAYRTFIMVDISVIIPVYNAAKFIARTIELVQNQTLDNWELVLVNDGSKDNSAEIIEQYAAKDSRIKSFHQNNAGPAAARNRAIERALGKYFICLDADDVFSTEMLATMHAEAERLQADMVMCEMEMVYPDERKVHLPHHIPCGHILSRKELTDHVLDLYFQAQPCGISSLWTKIFRTEWIKQSGLKLREDLIRAEDWFFILECLQLEPKVRFAAIDKVLYSYMYNENSVMHTYRDGEFRQVFELTKYLHEVGKKYGINKRNQFYRAIAYNSIEFLIAINRSNGKNKEEQIKEILENPIFKESLKHISEYSLTKRYALIAWLLKLNLKPLALKLC